MSLSLHNLREVQCVPFIVYLPDTVNIFLESERREDSFPTNYNSVPASMNEIQGKQLDKKMTPNVRFTHLEKIGPYISNGKI